MENELLKNMGKEQINKKLKNIINDLKPYDPEKIILFGSYARGDFKKDSDIDLLIIKKTKKPLMKRIDEATNLIYKKEYYTDDEKFPGEVDDIVYTPSQLKYRRDLGDFFVRRILKEGKVIYERKL